MNKLLTKIVGAALGVAMTVGVGVAVASQNNGGVQRAEAASGDSYSFETAAAISGTSTDTFWSFSAVKADGGSNPAWNGANKELRLYCGNKITFTGASGVTLDSAEFTCKFNASSSTKPTGWNVNHGSITTFSNSLTSFSVTSISYNSFTLTVTGSKGNLGLKTVKMTYTSSSTAQSITASANSAYYDQTISLTTNASSANWSITSNTAGASLSTSSAKTTVVSATQAGQVTVEASASGYTTVSKTLAFRLRPAGTTCTAVFGEADATSTVDFENTSFTIPAILTLDNVTGDVYGNNQNQPSAIKFGKNGGTGSFDVTIDSNYYITAIICNLKYYGTDTDAEFYVTPEGDSALTTTLTSVFTDYLFNVSSSEPSKITLGSVTNSKRVYLSEFIISYAERSGSVPATGVTVSPDTSTLFIGDTVQLTATVSPAGATDKSVSWESDDDSIASVDNTGLVTAVAEGETYITVTANGGENVQDIALITVSDFLTPTLVVSTGTGKTSYKFGEELDKTDWTATYTDNRGQESEVINSLNFGSINYIGTKSLTATYGGATSNGVNISVTNKDATCSSQTILEASAFSSGNMPDGWSEDGAGSDYAASHSPYLLKFDGNGDKLIASVNTSAPSITVELGVKMIGGATSSSFTVTALDENDELITSINSVSLSISGAQNDIVNPSNTLSNPDRENVRSIVFTFVKGANVGIGTGHISVIDPTSYSQDQALAWAQYFVDEVGGLCDAGGNTSEANVNAIKAKWSTLSNEYGWMIDDSKDYFASHTSNPTIARVIGMYERIVARYGQTNFIVDSEGNEVVGAQVNQVVANNSNTGTAAIIAIVSVISLSAVAGFFLLRKRKEQ